jgi:hypothetical protein
MNAPQLPGNNNTGRMRPIPRLLPAWAEPSSTTRTGTTELPNIVASLKRKREELDRSIALERNEEERRRLLAELATLRTKHNNSSDVASLEGTPQPDERKTADPKKALSFLIANCFGEYSVPEKTQRLVQTMAAAEPPQHFQKITGHDYWSVLSPWRPGAKTTSERPKSECEMLIQLHALLSRGKISTEDLSSTILMLISELMSTLLSSKFHQINAALNDLWRLASNARLLRPTQKDMLLFALGELGRTARARFPGPEGHEWYTSRCVWSHPADSRLIPTFTRAVLHSRQSENTIRLVSWLTRICYKDASRYSSLGLYVEKASGRAWLANGNEDEILLIHFWDRRIRIVHKSLFSLERSITDPDYVDLCIKNPEGEEGLRVQTLSRELCYWLLDWADVKGRYVGQSLIVDQPRPARNQLPDVEYPSPELLERLTPTSNPVILLMLWVS